MARFLETAKHQDPTTVNPTDFDETAKGTRHSIGIKTNGEAFSWGKSNAVGQLGRPNETASGKPGKIPLDATVKRAFCSQGCSTGSGHSALLDNEGRLWMAGCDRWQQLGLGSANGGSSGYTWIDGKLWQDRFVISSSVIDLMNERSSGKIRDVALGGDHTIILSSNQRDVYAFGKGGDGQLGLVGKPFVSAPVKSKILSEDEQNDVFLSAVCAFRNCSLTLDQNGDVRSRAGKCQAAGVQEGIDACIARARAACLISDEK